MNRFPGNAAKNHKRKEPSYHFSVQLSKGERKVAMHNLPDYPETKVTSLVVQEVDQDRLADSHTTSQG
jgi:hypothetical protein